MIPFAIIVAATILFFVLERVIPGRQLPEASGWYARAAFLNICQVGIVLLTGIAWNRWMQRWSVFHISSAMPAVAQGLLGWFIGLHFCFFTGGTECATMSIFYGAYSTKFTIVPVASNS